MKIFPSEANFLLLKTQIPLYRLLLERGILIETAQTIQDWDRTFTELP